jgi:hypothetical protein
MDSSNNNSEGSSSSSRAQDGESHSDANASSATIPHHDAAMDDAEEADVPQYADTVIPDYQSHHSSGGEPQQQQRWSRR